MQIDLLIFITIILISGILLSILVLILLRSITGRKVKKAEMLIKEFKDLTDQSADSTGSFPDDYVKRLKSLRDVSHVELILDRLCELKEQHKSRFCDLYDATGVTDHYVGLLKNSKSWKQRAFAAEKLGEIGSPDAVPELVSVVKDTKDEDEDVRGTALRALGKIRDKRAIPFLIEALGYPETWLSDRIAEVLFTIGEEAIEPLKGVFKNDRSEKRRMWAAEILGWLEAKSAVYLLIEALSDVSPEVRGKVAGALGKIPDEKAISRLCEILISDPVPFVRVRASQALGAIGHPVIIDYLINVLKDPEWWVRVRAVEALEQFGDKAVSSLLVALEDEDEEVRRRSAMALERIGYVEKIIDEYGQKEYNPGLRKTIFLVVQTGVIESITDKLIHSEPQLKKRIVRILGEAHVTAASGSLLELLEKTSEWTLKSRVIQCLGRLGIREAIPSLINCLKNGELWVRKTAVEALGLVGTADLGDEIVGILDDPSPYARESALSALSRLQITAYQEKVQNLLADPAPRVRSAAIRHIRETGIPVDKEKMVDLLSDSAEEVRLEVMRYFSDNADAAVLSHIVNLLRFGSNRIRSEIVHYIRQIKPSDFQVILDSVDIDQLPVEALSTLIDIASAINDDSVSDFLIRYTTNAEPLLRSEACYALSLHGSEKHQKILGRALSDPSELVRIAILKGIALNPNKQLLELAGGRFEDPDMNVRTALALAIGASSDPKYKQILITMLDDHSVRVEAAALFSLASFDDPVVLETVQSKKNISRIKDEVKAITSDNQFEMIVEIIRSRARESDNLAVEMLLVKDEKGFAQNLEGTIKVTLDPETRLKAMEMLKIIATGDMFIFVLGIMKKDPSPRIRIKAMELLTSMDRDAEAISALSPMLIDPVLEVRNKAADSLGQYKRPEALEALLHVLDTSDRQFREAVTSSLSRMLMEDYDRLADLIKGVPESKWRKIGMAWLMGKTRQAGAMKFLKGLLEDDEPDVRASAVGALAKFNKKQLVKTLGKVVYDPNERVRSAAINAISTIGGNEAFELVEASLKDIDAFVRVRAAVGLAKLDPERSIAVLTGRLKEFPELRSCISGIKFAAGLSYDASVRQDPLSTRIVEEMCPETDMLKDLRSSPDKDKRLHAIRVLSLVRPELSSLVGEITQKDPSSEVRQKARSSMGK